MFLSRVSEKSHASRLEPTKKPTLKAFGPDISQGDGLKEGKNSQKKKNL